MSKVPIRRSPPPPTPLTPPRPSPPLTSTGGSGVTPASRQPLRTIAPPPQVRAKAPPVTVWENRRVTLKMKDSGTKSVFADTHSNLAVHPSDGRSGGWEVTHVPTGRFVAWSLREADARRVVEALAEEVPEALEERTAVAVVGRLPAWVNPWLVAVTRAGCYLSPTPYKTGHTDAAGA